MEPVEWKASMAWPLLDLNYARAGLQLDEEEPMEWEASMAQPLLDLNSVPTGLEIDEEEPMEWEASGTQPCTPRVEADWGLDELVKALELLVIK